MKGEEEGEDAALGGEGAGAGGGEEESWGGERVSEGEVADHSAAAGEGGGEDKQVGLFVNTLLIVFLIKILPFFSRN